MHAALLVLLALVLMSWPPACAAESSDATLPIMAWDYADDESTLRLMADCGVNLVAFAPPSALDACAKAGVKAIVYQPGVTPDWDQPFKFEPAADVLRGLIARVNDHPAVYGYHIKDEPDPSQFAELAKAVALVNELAPGKWPYINLPPGMGEGYDGYLDLFVNTCRPDILSYDNYPVGQDGSFSYGFWANIAQVRKAGLRHNLPFWTIVLSSAHLTYGEPSEAHLRLQAWGSLVYGARGVCYYKFISRSLPILDAPDLGDWRNGPLDQFGEKTHAWSWMRNLNRQLQNVAPIFLKLKSDRVYHVGEVPQQNEGITGDSLVKGLRAGEAFIVGDFTHQDGSRWVMIVNKHLRNSVQCLPDFRQPAAVEYVSPITGELKPFPEPWYCLAPGQGVLLKLTPKPEPASAD
ncbi:MAG: hypothetical protein DCC67_01315 [Planctomycetota bacterium]|nr:MAG: hypothetical protein DCC67_01315 [Planctomycetota bacterium]